MANKQINQYEATELPARDDLLLKQPSAGGLYETLTPAQLLSLLLATDLPAHASTHERDGTDPLTNLGAVTVLPATNTTPMIVQAHADASDDSILVEFKNAAGSTTAKLLANGRLQVTGVDNVL